MEEINNQKALGQTILKCKMFLYLKTVENKLIFIKIHFFMFVTTTRKLYVIFYMSQRFNLRRTMRLQVYLYKHTRACRHAWC